MPLFHYIAFDTSGHELDADLEAANEADAVNLLKSRQLTVVELKVLTAARAAAAGEALVMDEPSGGRGRESTRIPLPIILWFYEQVNFFFSAGIPIALCIRMTADILKNKALEKLLRRVLFDITEGVSFSAALKKYPDHFPRLHVQIIGVGEKTGKLDRALLQLVDLVRERSEIFSRATAAMSYPLFLAGISGAMGFGMIYFVFPKFQEIFAGHGVALPGVTVFLMDVSTFLRGNFLALAVGLGVSGAGLWAMRKSALVERFQELVLLHTPLVKDVYMSMFISLFAKTVASLLRSGTPLLEALTAFRESLGAGRRRTCFDELIESVKEGEPVSSVMQRQKFFPELVWQLVSVGEKTGDIAAIMEKLFAYYKTKYSERLMVLTSLLQPLLMVLAAAFIGLIAIALFVPLFKLSSAAKRD